jgi:dolichyl-phosphate beta-glucosyltransferase
MDLSIIIPAYNEELRIGVTLEEIRSFITTSNLSVEVIVVDDGSTDQTIKVVNDFCASAKFCRCLQQSVNMGKGAAVRVGVLNAAGALVLFADADGSTPIAEVHRLIAALREEKAAVAIGSRALCGQGTRIRARMMRKLLGRIFNFFVNLLAVPKIKDTQCGFKLFKHDVVRPLFEKQKFPRFSFDLEILWRAHKLNFKVVEVPINWHHVAGSKVRVVHDGLRMLRDAFVLAFSRAT